MICLENMIQLRISEALLVNSNGAKGVRCLQKFEVKRAYQLQQKESVDNKFNKRIL